MFLSKSKVGTLQCKPKWFWVISEVLPYFFNELEKLGLADPGFNSTVDITACPGTDTCALGVTNSTGLAKKLEEVIKEEYPVFIEETNLDIKISGCMNSCGQHMAAQIGFHGSSIKQKPLVIPAMQIVLGGGVDPDGTGQIAEKVIKVPTRRVPDALRTIIDDYGANATEGEYFNHYYRRQGKRYFYSLLKELASLASLSPDLFFDWGQDQQYKQEIGVGECAGVALDVVGTIINDAAQKVQYAQSALEQNAWADSIYHSYSAMVVGAKALLLAADVKCNTHKGIIADFQTHYIDNQLFKSIDNFADLVLKINKTAPSEAFARTYAAEAKIVFDEILSIRKTQLTAEGGQDKLVIDQYYKA